MNNFRILVIISILFVLYSVFSGGIKENVGSDWFHRGKLADISQHIQKQIAEAKKRYNSKENFASLKELDDNYIKDLKLNIKDLPKEKYDPNRYVISNYSFKELKPTEEKELDEIQVGMLESKDFAKPVDYTENKPFAEYLEVDKYNAGSGDLSKINEVYNTNEKNNFMQTVDDLRVRGGNVFMKEKKNCNVK